jgi:GH24 family phage-related lysozyme (muramidase)
MAGSRMPKPEAGSPWSRLDQGLRLLESQISDALFPSRTPGPLGRNDAADPDGFARLGDTPGATGVNDGALMCSIAEGLLHCTTSPGLAASAPALAHPAVDSSPRNMTTSEAGLQLIEESEGFRARLYNDAAGHCTIGYGHLVHRGNCNGRAPSEIRFRHGISRSDAEALLSQQVSQFEAVVSSSVKVPLNQSQFDALVDFCYNLGPSAFKNSTLLEKLNSGDYSAVPAELLKYVYAGGRKLAGLQRRREREVELWNSQTEADPSDKIVLP